MNGCLKANSSNYRTSRNINSFLIKKNIKTLFLFFNRLSISLVKRNDEPCSIQSHDLTLYKEKKTLYE